MNDAKQIPFNRPYMTGTELPTIADAHQKGRLSGDGEYTSRCHDWLQRATGTAAALLTHSCTAALEMSALLVEIKPGDEVIMPSFTFVSTANAFALRGAQPVFIDIRPDTLNLDESLIEAAITNKTRAIVPVHYAGVACEMDAINAIAEQHELAVIEDAAQGVLGSYKGRALGTLGDLGSYSFHETKNVISGEGGALLVNREEWVEEAEIIREKGTDRSQFFRGAVDKYTWKALGSSFLPGELVAAFLFAQLEAAERITAERLSSWAHYHQALEPLELEGLLRRPVVPEHCQHNGHMYYVLLAEGIDRDWVLQTLSHAAIHAVFHYVPLHQSPAGQRFCRTAGPMEHTEALPEQLIRLPMWVGLELTDIRRVVAELEVAIKTQ
jgi:dTDP-4-amino-4,6-dideoxygalactose transaminase